MPHRTRVTTAKQFSTTMNPRDQLVPEQTDFPLNRYSNESLPITKPDTDTNSNNIIPPAHYQYLSSSADSFQRPSMISESSKSSTSSAEDGKFVRLARRRATKSIKERASQRKSTLSRPQGRPLSKETRVRLTLVPTMGILYSILVSDTMRKPLKVVKYSRDADSVPKTNEEMSTKNVISGFSSMLNVKSARFNDDPTVSPDRSSTVPQFKTIDEAVYELFGLTEYSLIRVTRAAATEVGGSVLLKIETAMPGYLFLNDDEEDDFSELEMNKELYQESIGHLGDRPTTTFLKKRVARPRYKSEMRIYLIPRATNCAIYCEKRIFKRDLMRGFLDFNKCDRSIIVGFDYADALTDLLNEGRGDLFAKFSVPTPEQVEEIQKTIHETTSTELVNTNTGMYSGYQMTGSSQGFQGGPQRGNATVYGGLMRNPNELQQQNTGGMLYDQNVSYMPQQAHSYQMPISQQQQQQQQASFGYPSLVGYGNVSQGQQQPQQQPQFQQQVQPQLTQQMALEHQQQQQSGGVYMSEHQQPMAQSMSPQPGYQMYFNAPGSQQLSHGGSSSSQMNQRATSQTPGFPVVAYGSDSTRVQHTPTPLVSQMTAQQIQQQIQQQPMQQQWVDPYASSQQIPQQVQPQQQGQQPVQSQSQQYQQTQQYYQPIDGYTMQMMPPPGYMNSGL